MKSLLTKETMNLIHSKIVQLLSEQFIITLKYPSISKELLCIEELPWNYTAFGLGVTKVDGTACALWKHRLYWMVQHCTQLCKTHKCMRSTCKRGTRRESPRNMESRVIDWDHWRVPHGDICTGSWMPSRTSACKEQVMVPHALGEDPSPVNSVKHLTESQSLSSTDIQHEDTTL